MVPATASSGVDMTATMGRTSARKTTIRATDTAMNSETVLPMTAEIFLWSWAPMARPMLTVVPMASPTIMTVIMCMTWLPTETAVVEAAPSYWPDDEQVCHAVEQLQKIGQKIGQRKVQHIAQYAAGGKIFFPCAKAPAPSAKWTRAVWCPAEPGATFSLRTFYNIAAKPGRRQSFFEKNQSFT